jgi:hypothetical protein
MSQTVMKGLYVVRLQYRVATAITPPSAKRLYHHASLRGPQPRSTSPSLHPSYYNQSCNDCPQINYEGYLCLSCLPHSPSCTSMVTFRFLISILPLASLCAALPRTGRTIQWIDYASHVPHPLKNTTLPANLPSTLHCGRLDVPMEYSEPMSENNTITLGFSMYRPQNPKGLINL